MKSMLLLSLIVANISSAYASDIFVKSEIPSSVGNMEEKPFQTHKYRGSLYGYLHHYKGEEGTFALLKFSDGTKGANTVRATLVCKDSSGTPIGALPIENWMGASHQTMVHRYYYKVNCPGLWGIAWNDHTNYFDPAPFNEAALKLLVSYVISWL